MKYFGCIDRAGHFLWERPHSTDVLAGTPWGYDIDGKLCPEGPEIEGQAKLHRKDGWTAIAFWDRSIDQRGKSNSAFIEEGELSFDEMLRIANTQFPDVLRRFKFEILEQE